MLVIVVVIDRWRRCRVRRHCGFVVVDFVVRRCLSGREIARSVLCAIGSCWEIEKFEDIIVVVVFVCSGRCCRWQVRRRRGVIGAALCGVLRVSNLADTLRKVVEVDTRWWWCQGESGSVSSWIQGCDRWRRSGWCCVMVDEVSSVENCYVVWYVAFSTMVGER